MEEATIKVVGNYSPSEHEASRIVSAEGVYPTVKENHGTIPAVAVSFNLNESERFKTPPMVETSKTLLSNKAQCGVGVEIRESEAFEGVKIRKLTPKECFRLMGVSDADYEKIAKNQSDSSLYHLAGDSIITNCLMAIFKEMF